MPVLSLQTSRSASVHRVGVPVPVEAVVLALVLLAVVLLVVELLVVVLPAVELLVVELLAPPDPSEPPVPLVVDPPGPAVLPVVPVLPEVTPPGPAVLPVVPALPEVTPPVPDELPPAPVSSAEESSGPAHPTATNPRAIVKCFNKVKLTDPPWRNESIPCSRSRDHG
ncbi:hypothetical protein [Sorangium sp. So ce128]|uniref:hypothetical protein n=1 Tax=Sorangium sp. So ce128 TaxID=3133281 RepID=UPI003F6425E4